MANIVLFDAGYTGIPGKVIEYLPSANTASYVGDTGALKNPDMSAVTGVVQRFWKVDLASITGAVTGMVGTGDIVEMTYAEKDTYLPSEKETKLELLRNEAEATVDGRYNRGVQQNLNMLLREAYEKGFDDRQDYLIPWSDWVQSVYDEVGTKEDAIAAAGSYTGIEGIIWDFSGYADTDPDVNVAGAKDLKGQTISARFEAYMEMQNATRLSLNRYKGRSVMVGREEVVIPISGIKLNVTDNLITSSGADAGSAMAAETLYYVYLSNSEASPFPSNLRASTTAPSLINGIKYLGTDWNARRWRFVGWVMPNQNTNFVDNERKRLVINHYNAKRLYGYLNPGYTDDNSPTEYNFTATNFAPLNGPSTKFEWIANGEDSIQYEFNALAGADGNNRAMIGVGEDSDTSATTAMTTPGNVTRIEVSTGRAYTPTEGYHYLRMLGCVTGGTGTMWVDLARRGSSEDPRTSYLSIILFG